MDIDFGWVLLLAGFAGGIPTAKALLVRHKRTPTRWLRLIVHALLLLLGALEVQRHDNWHPLRRPAPDQPSQTAAGIPPA